jgi:hypothetical protein
MGEWRSGPGCAVSTPALQAAGEQESIMPGASISRRAMQPQEKREVKYVVRAPDSNNRGKWVTVGVAFERKNGEEGLSVKLNSLPLGNWDGALILLPPIVPEGEGEPEE